MNFSILRIEKIEKMQYTSLASDRVPWMNLADSMRSQDNINKVVFTGERNIEYYGENIIYCLWIE